MCEKIKTRAQAIIEADRTMKERRQMAEFYKTDKVPGFIWKDDVYAVTLDDDSVLMMVLDEECIPTEIVAL